MRQGESEKEIKKERYRKRKGKIERDKIEKDKIQRETKDIARIRQNERKNNKQRESERNIQR